MLKHPAPDRTDHDIADPSDKARMSRRAWISTATGAAVAAGLVKTQFDAVDLSAQQVPAADPTKVMGRIPSEVGTRAKYETPKRFMRPTDAKPNASSRSPIAHFDGIITPSDLHFERHHAGIPDIDPASYELLIHGMVERPMVFKLADLKRYPSVSRIHFLECSGNGGGSFNMTRMPTDVSPQQMDGLLSTSEWTGVPLATLMREVGVKPGATWIVAEGGDAAMLNRSIPMSKVMDDAMIAYGQNGEAVRPEQGYPARVFLPGFEGNMNVKWVRRIEVTDAPVMSREETSNYTDALKGGKARMFSFVMDAKSVITFPSFPMALPDKGWWEIKGLAWSGRGKIIRVDLSTDRGRTWFPAQLQDPVLPLATTRFRSLWNWDGAETVLMSRAIDDTGYVQPSVQQFVDARGERTNYHSNHMRAWKVATDGKVTYGLGDTL
jgi:sulfane dehydrogenase subunit SoxC